MGFHVLIVGMGVSGQAAADLAIRKGYEVSCYDDSADAGYLDDISESLWNLMDLCVVSPGIPWTHPVVQSAMEKQIEIKSEIDFAAQFIPEGTLCIGVTGTNGKTTMCMILQAYFEAMSKQVCVAGNIGVPLSEVVDALVLNDILVLELSSFQLLRTNSLSLDIALILNLAEDHLDWHDNLDEYFNSKLSIMDLVKPKGHIFIGADLVDLPHFVNKGIECGVCSYEHGHFEWLESLAMCLKWPTDNIVEILSRFKRAPHRLQYVREFEGVHYINDSKATNIHAMIYAVNDCVGSELILIFGGKDKHLDLSVVSESLLKGLKCLILMGEVRERAKLLWQHYVKIVEVDSMEEAVSQAYSHASDTDTVLLSPACSSYDMYDGYEQRGDEFMYWVHSL